MTEAHAGNHRPVGALSDTHPQHPSHLNLLDLDARPTTIGEVDAIIVPTARRRSELRSAVRLAKDLGCPLVVLCSRDVSARSVAAVARRHRVEPIAVDVHDGVSLPALETAGKLAGTVFDRTSDTALKRNVALALSRMVGWRRVLFLDDDVTVADRGALRAAAALLNRYAAVGLENVGFADNSVVCHANRDTGGRQDYFVGAGGLLVNTARTESFFPDVYNEDWFFLLDGDTLTDVARSGTCAQAKFDPYRHRDRARQEEFGDCLAEGLFSLLDDGVLLDGADHAFWRDFLQRRAELIMAIRARLRPFRRWRARRIRAALQTSLDTLRQITPEQCVDYLAAWRRDRDPWRAYLAGLPQGRTVDQALAELGLSPVR